MVTDRLLEGARATLREHGVGEEAIDVVFVPGAWELTPAARHATTMGYDAIVALGCVVRGDTPHFELICRSVTEGLTRLNAEQRTPIVLGVLTTDNMAQARDRAGGTVGNLGSQAAEAALTMSDLLTKLGEGGGEG
jgi:6,7-dimethyl-8-ribityllumazine synthase